MTTKNKANILFFLLYALLTLSPSILRGQEEVNIAFAQPTEQKKLILDVFKGDITIVGSDRKDVWVRYDVQAEQAFIEVETEDRSKGMQKVSSGTINLEMASEENVVSIRVDGNSKKIGIEIEVPRDIDIEIDVEFSADVDISQISGNLNLELSAGDINVQQLSGLINASTAEGDITIDWQQIPKPKSMIIATTFGDIDLSFPPGYSTLLRLKADKGDIYADFPINFSETSQSNQSENDPFHYRDMSWQHAKLNGGDKPEISIKTKLGSIYLRQK
ncbi:MAG: DUF4097 family beta strand repeat-containing protein [Bacteroidia bacterium]